MSKCPLCEIEYSHSHFSYDIAEYVETMQSKLEQRIAMEIDEHLKVVKLQAKLDIAVDKLHEIDNWAKAYPLEVFPEPDWQKAKELLGSNLLTCISASNMRHVIDGVSSIVQEALKRLEE
jgi:hypothetical protein